MTKKALTIQNHKQINNQTREIARQRIQLVAIINKLQNSVLHNTDEEHQLTPSAVKAAMGLLQVAGMITTKVEQETTINHQYSITSETIKLLREANKRIIEMDENSVVATVTQAETIPAEYVPRD